MVKTCSKCSRANPAEAVYCYFDGFVLGGQLCDSGPMVIGAQLFPHPFVFPSGRQCRSFDELALACQEEWAVARTLLSQGYLENFFRGLGRVDLVLAAQEAAKFPDADLGLHQLLEKLPTQVLAQPRLSLETQEINLGILEVGEERQFHLHMENQGMLLISGTITNVDAPWLALGETAGHQKHFHFQHELDIRLCVRSDKLRASDKPLEGHLEIESNGGSFIVTVYAQVPVKPFPYGVLTGAKSPRQLAEKAKAHSKEAALLFESGAVAQWYKANGWTYPVQGPVASGLGAVQQFFEALGLTTPPKVAIHPDRIDLVGTPGEQLRYDLMVQTQEKRPVYAHAVSNQPWLEVGRPQLAGRIATLPLVVSSVPDREGETLTATLTVQANGNQRFVVPVTLHIGGSLVFRPNLAVVESRTAQVEGLAAAPLVVPPIGAANPLGKQRRRRTDKPMPFWVHGVPAVLLLFTVFAAVVVDRLLPSPGTDRKHEDSRSPTGSWTYVVNDPEPRILVQFDSERERFGVEMTQERDPDNPKQFKRLTYDSRGRSNNTLIKIDDYEYKFGEETPSNVWGGGRGGRLKRVAITQGGRRAWESTMEFRAQKIEVVQHVEIVPGQTGYLDTLLVYYTLYNKDRQKHKVGIRVMIDTFIGANDGVPFTIPGQQKFVDTQAEFSGQDIPDYIEAIENPDDPQNPGTVARMGLRHFTLPGLELEDMDKLRICRFPGPNVGWEDWPVESMKPNSKESKKDRGDSCVVLYWPYQEMNPGQRRHVAFTYGLGSLEIGGALALSVPAAVQPNSEFVVTAYIWDAHKGDQVTLIVPAGLELAKGEPVEKTIEESGTRSQVFWRLRSGSSGEYVLEAATNKGKSKPKKVVVKAMSIFG